MNDRLSLIELDPEEIADDFDAGSILLVDVREPHEFDMEHIEGALLLPLSIFDPADLPDPEGKRVVFQCASGIRSRRAVEACLAAGLAYNSHLRGGIHAWKASGGPTVR